MASMIWISIAGGFALGLLSRLEEATPGFYLAISTSSVWLAAAFAAGWGGRRPWPAAGLGALTLSSANAGYYLRGVYGPMERWVLLGLIAGAVFGGLGHACRSGAAPWRQLAVAALLAVGLFELTGAQLPVFGLSLP